MPGRFNTGLGATLLAGVLLAGAVACTGGGDVETRLALARASIDRGELGAATLELGNLIQRHPQNIVVRLLHAEVSLASGRAGAAERQLRRARDLGAPDDRLLPMLGRALLAQGKFRQVLNEARLQDVDGELALQILTLRGNAHLGLGQTPQSESMFRNALARDGDYVPARVGLARVLAVGGDSSSARTILAATVDARPFSVLAQQSLGALLFDQGRYAEAEGHFIDAIETAAGLEEADALMLARVGLVECQWRVGKRDKALLNANDLLDEFPWHPLPKYLRAILAFEDGDYALANENLESVLRILPDHRPSLQLTAAANFAQGRLGPAEMRLGDLLRHTPDDFTMVRLLADTYLRMGNAAQAVATINQAGHFEADTSLLDLRGTANLYAGNTPDALGYLRAAAATNAGNMTLQTRLAAALLNAGRILEADRLMGAWPTDVATEEARMILRLTRFQRASEPRRAIEYAKRRRRNDPADLHALLALAEAAEFSSDREQARRWLGIARERNPDALEPRLLLANYAERDGDYDALLALARESLALQPYNDTVLAQLGEAQLARGQKSLALATFREALRVAPDASRNLLNLARAELAAGNFAIGRDLVVDAAAPGTWSDALVRDVLVEQARRGQPDRAMELAHAIQERFRRSTLGFELAGDLYLLDGDLAAASAAYDSALRIEGDRLIAVKAFITAQAQGARSATRPLQRWLDAKPDDAQIERLLRAAGG